MTDQVDLPEPQWGGEETWEQAIAAATAPDPAPTPQVYTAPIDTRENHLFTISITPGKAPMVVVRGDNAMQVKQLLEQLDQAGVYLAMAAAEQQIRNAKPPVDFAAQQFGATVMGQYGNPGHNPPMPPANAGQPPFGAPPGGYQPPPPQGGWGQDQAPAGVPAGWLQVRIPFTARAEGDALKEWLHSQGLRQGNMRWDGPNKRWLVSPAIAQYFAKWNPVPA